MSRKQGSLSYWQPLQNLFEAVGSSIAPANSIRVWALSEVSDVFGNKYTISYKEDKLTGNYYPEQISYNNRTIAFTYETKPEATPNYAYGSLVNENQRLKKISIQVDSSEINNYGFVYDNTSVNKKTLLKSITRKGYTSLDFIYSNNPVIGAIASTVQDPVQLVSQVRNPVRNTSPPASSR